MTPLRGGLKAVLSSLEAVEAPFALVGGLAVSVRTEPRFTRDIDIAVAVSSDQEAEAVVRALQSDEWTLEALVEQDAVARLATARLAQVEEGYLVDVLFASSGIEQEIVDEADVMMVFPRTTVPVATVSALIVMKLLAAAPDRPQDNVDLQSLVKVSTQADIRRAEELSALVVERGFRRDRDLLAHLDNLTNGD